MPGKNMVPDTIWEEKAVALELGLIHANQIARDLGVSPQTVSRQMKKRGVVKGSRVSETIEDLVAILDRKARRTAIAHLSESQRKNRVVDANAKAAGSVVAAILSADRRNDLPRIAPVIRRLSKAISGKRNRRSRS